MCLNRKIVSNWVIDQCYGKFITLAHTLVLLSVQERVIECVLVPISVPIEDEKLTSGLVSENKVLIEDHTIPHEFVLNSFGINLLKVIDVHYVLGSVAKEEWFLEDNLLRVRKELSMPAEVFLLNPPPWDESEWDEHWQESNVRAGSPSREGK